MFGLSIYLEWEHDRPNVAINRINLAVTIIIIFGIGWILLLTTSKFYVLLNWDEKWGNWKYCNKWLATAL